jgi:hypothetical protein
MHRHIVALALVVILPLLAMGALCTKNGNDLSTTPSVPGETPSRQLMPLDFDEDSQPSPPGFSSWEAYVDFVEGLLYADGGVRPPGGLTKPAQVTINPDGTLTIVPGIVTQPDGSTGQWIGKVPNESSIRVHEDGSVTVFPPDRLPETPSVPPDG